MQSMCYIGLDVHKRKISYCGKDGSGKVYAEGSPPATRVDVDLWMKTLPRPWTAAMEATSGPELPLGASAPEPSAVSLPPLI